MFINLSLLSVSHKGFTRTSIKRSAVRHIYHDPPLRFPNVQLRQRSETLALAKLRAEVLIVVSSSAVRIEGSIWRLGFDTILPEVLDNFELSLAGRESIVHIKKKSYQYSWIATDEYTRNTNEVAEYYIKNFRYKFLKHWKWYMAS